MTKFTQIFLLGAASVALSGLASGTSLCNNTGYTASQLNAGLQCEVGDKIFTFGAGAFTAPTVSDGATGGFAIVSLAGPATSPYAGGFNVQVTDSGGGTITGGFALNYAVTIDTLAPGAALNFISSFASGIGDSSTIASSAINNAVLTGGATCNAGNTDNNDTITPTGNCTGLHATATINVADTFTYNTVGNGLASVSNTFTQAVGSNVPEPTTFVLMGAGLGLLGMIGRKAPRR